jgi:hypothetical protein
MVASMFSVKKCIVFVPLICWTWSLRLHSYRWSHSSSYLWLKGVYSVRENPIRPTSPTFSWLSITLAHMRLCPLIKDKNLVWWLKLLDSFWEFLSNSLFHYKEFLISSFVHRRKKWGHSLIPFDDLPNHFWRKISRWWRQWLCSWAFESSTPFPRMTNSKQALKQVWQHNWFRFGKADSYSLTISCCEDLRGCEEMRWNSFL